MWVDGVRMVNPGLTPRLSEVWGLVAQGLSNSEIADRLCVDVRTVHIYLHRIYQKKNLQASSRAEVCKRRSDVVILAREEPFSAKAP